MGMSTDMNEGNAQKVCLCLEGGSMRGLYTAGILDTFMDEGIQIDGFVGVSAGAVFGVNYFSNQRGRVLRYNKQFCNDPRYSGLRSLITTGNLVNRQFAYYDVTTIYDVFDDEAFIKNNTGYIMTATDMETGKAEYFETKSVLDSLEIVRATSGIPFATRPVDVGGRKYLDGGVSDSIPIRKCLELGYGKIIVVLTRPLSYRKKPYSSAAMAAVKMKYRKYPRFVEAIANRHQNYNESIDLIKELEASGKIFVFRPPTALDVGMLEKSAEKLQAVYDLGASDCLNRLDDLREYLGIK